MTRWGDERAQSIQVGAIVLFGFVVLAFSGYQAGVVPQQNEEVEFGHSLQVESDVQELRNDVLEAGATGRMRAVGVTLGTTYPPRILAMNPSPPGGTLRTESVGPGEITVDAPDFDVEDVCGFDRDGDDSVPSRSFVYEPSYNVYQEAPTVVYENTVVYRDFGGRVIFDSDQRLVDGREITLVPLVGDYQESGTRSVSVDLNGGATGVGETGDTGPPPTITIPTRLNVSQWERLLSNEMNDAGGRVLSVEENGTAVDIRLKPGIYTVECPVVGAGETPDNLPTRILGEDGTADNINPGGPGTIQLTDISRASSTNPKIIELTLENAGERANLSTARFNFFYDQNGDGAEQLDIRETETGSAVVENLELRGSAKSPTSVVTFPADSTKTLYLRFEDGTGSLFDVRENDFAIVSMQFPRNRGGSYFVDVPNESDTSGGGGSSPSIDTFVVSDGSAGDAEYTVDWSVSDADGDLTNVTVELIRKNGNKVVNSSSSTIGGDSGSGTNSLTHKKGEGNEYEIRLTVSDAGGNTASDSVIDVAGGTEPI